MEATAEKILGYTFKEPKLLEQALIHPSKIGGQKFYDFERLEFLGDRVLGLVVANLLYHYYPKKTEGELAQKHGYLVSREMCNIMCIEIGLSKLVQFRQSDVSSINLSIAANAFEAILGAMFLDGGLIPCQEFLERLWRPRISSSPSKDAKSTLQELAAQKLWEVPDYEVQERTGPDHAPMFTVKVSTSKKSALGVGASLKVAEQKAAKAFLEKLQKPSKKTKPLPSVN